MDVPVSEAHNPRGLRYIIDFLHPGMVIHRRILVVSQESHRTHLTVYPDAAQIKKGYFIGDAGKTRSELTTWIKIAHSKVSLGPSKSVMDLVTIKVPKVATRGEHYGVIWVQQTSIVRRGSGIAVKEINRVGIRIYLAIGRGGVPATRFSISAITGHKSPKGKPYLTALVHNTGGRAVDVSGTVRLTHGPGGTSAGPFSLRQVVTLAPGQSQPVTFVPPRSLPAGPWLASVRLVSGMTVERASATISFSRTAQTSLWLKPLTMIWVGAIAALILIGLWIGWRSRRMPRGVHSIRVAALR
ncbi:MAG TPA: hypothetical protein VFI65_17910 [Streptosporangiaceae bacterium]|nr:hypothetical protein [Streptosporangiaceae bacterium]